VEKFEGSSSVLKSYRFCKIGALDESAIVLQHTCSVQCAHRPPIFGAAGGTNISLYHFVEYLFRDYWAFCSGFTQDVDHFHE
jgi:hypothetical protein